MRKILLFFFILSYIICDALAQPSLINQNSPPYVSEIYTVLGYPNNYPFIYDICTDKDGDMYVCGDAKYQQPYFGDSLINSYKCFIAKINPIGHLLFSVNINASFFGDYAMGNVCVDGNKNIYSKFSANHNITFNNNIYHPANGIHYIAKWDSLGNEIWVKQIDTYAIYDITVNQTGTDIISTGIFSISMQIDSIQYFYCGNNTIMNDVFIASFDATNGNTQWVEIIGNEGNETIYSIEVDEEGNVYAPIQFYGDSTQVGNYSITRTNTHEYMATVLSKLNPSGLVVWNFLFDGKVNIRNTDFINEQFYFSCFMNTDTLRIDTLVYTNPTSSSGLYGKISPAGILQWLTTIETDLGHVTDYGLSTNQIGETLVYGTKNESATFRYGSQILDSSINNRFYLKLDNSGNILWYKSYRITPVNTGSMLDIAWGKNKDFYSLFNNLHESTVFKLGNYTITDSLEQFAFIPKMLDYSQQQVPLPAGWGMVSSYLEPYEDSLEAVLDSLAGNLIILKNNAGNVYWPQFGVNTINNWDYTQGYQTKMALADSLFMLGGKIQPDTALLQINTGWNIIPYFNYQPIDTDSVFANYVSNVIIVKDGTGQIYWPQYSINTIGHMLPGRGYQLKAWQGFNFYYPPE
jgi:hypothetical protein